MILVLLSLMCHHLWAVDHVFIDAFQGGEKCLDYTIKNPSESVHIVHKINVDRTLTNGDVTCTRQGLLSQLRITLLSDSLKSITTTGLLHFQGFDIVQLINIQLVVGTLVVEYGQQLIMTDCEITLNGTASYIRIDTQTIELTRVNITSLKDIVISESQVNSILYLGCDYMTLQGVYIKNLNQYFLLNTLFISQLFTNPIVELVTRLKLSISGLRFYNNTITYNALLRVIWPRQRSSIKNLIFTLNNLMSSALFESLPVKQDIRVDIDDADVIHTLTGFIVEGNEIKQVFSTKQLKLYFESEKTILIQNNLQMIGVRFNDNTIRGDFSLATLLEVQKTGYFGIDGLVWIDNTINFIYYSIIHTIEVSRVVIADANVTMSRPQSLNFNFMMPTTQNYVAGIMGTYMGIGGQLCPMSQVTTFSFHPIYFVQIRQTKELIRLTRITVLIVVDVEFILLKSVSDDYSPNVKIYSIDLHRIDKVYVYQSVILLDGVYTSIRIAELKLRNIDSFNPLLYLRVNQLDSIIETLTITLTSITMASCTLYTLNFEQVQSVISIESQSACTINLEDVDISNVILTNSLNGVNLTNVSCTENTTPTSLYSNFGKISSIEKANTSFNDLQGLIHINSELSSVVLQSIRIKFYSREQLGFPRSNATLVGLLILASEMTLQNSIFVNESEFNGKAFIAFGEGGHANIIIFHRLLIENCYFYGMDAKYGAGLMIRLLAQDTSLLMINTNFTQLHASVMGGALLIETAPKSINRIEINNCNFTYISGITGIAITVITAYQFQSLDLTLKQVAALGIFGLGGSRGVFLLIDDSRTELTKKDNNITITLKKVHFSNKLINNQSTNTLVRSLVEVGNLKSVALEEVELMHIVNYIRLFDLRSVRDGFRCYLSTFENIILYSSEKLQASFMTSKIKNLMITNSTFHNLSQTTPKNIKIEKCSHLFQLREVTLEIHNSLFHDIRNVYLFQLNQSDVTINASQFVNITNNKVPTDIHISPKQGGTIALWESNLTIISSLFKNNTGARFGGAIFYFVTLTIKQLMTMSISNNSLFAKNQASYGRSIFYQYDTRKLLLFTDSFVDSPAQMHKLVHVEPSSFQCIIIEADTSTKNKGSWNILMNATLGTTTQTAAKSLPSGSNISVELHFEAQERFWHRKVPLLTYPTIMALPRPECKVSIDTFDINEERIIHNLSFAQSSLNHSLSVMAVNFTLYDSHNTQKDLILKTENCLINWDKSNNKQLFFITMDFRACIPGEYRVVNRTYCIKCKSKEQYTLANNSEKCERCDNQIMICEDGKIFALQDKYWRKNESVDEIKPCETGQCIGTNINQSYCNQGYIGPLCQTCDYKGTVWNDTYFPLSRTVCLKCSVIANNHFKGFLNVGIFVLLVLISLLVNLDGILCSLQVDILRQTGMQHLGNSGQVNLPSIYNKILLNHLQILSILGEMGLDPNDIGLGQTLNIFGNGISFSTTSLDCFLSDYNIYDISQAYFRFICQILMPVIISGLMSFCYFIICLLSHKLIFSKRIVFFIVLYSYLFLFSSLSNNILSFLSCKNIAGDLYLKGDLTQGCYARTHSKFVFYLIIPNFLIYDIILPWSIFLYLGQQAKNLDSFEVAYRFRILYQDYTKSAYYFEFVKMIMKITMALILNVWSSETNLKSQVVIFILIIYYRLVETLGPYFQPKLTNLDNLSTIAQITTIIIYLMKSKDPDQILSVIIYVIIGGINFFYLLWMVFILIKCYFDLYIELIANFLPTSILFKNLKNRSQMKSQTRKNWRRMKIIITTLFIPKDRIYVWQRAAVVQKYLQDLKEEKRKQSVLRGDYNQ